MTQVNPTELDVLEQNPAPESAIPIARFITDFGDGLLDAVRTQNPPVYDGTPDPRREARMDRLLRAPFPAQREVVQAVSRLLFDADQPAAVINAEMGTGKTLMGTAIADIAHLEGYPRTLVIAPPHLVYKWRRERKQTVPEAAVCILNGPDTLKKLIALRGSLARPATPEFYILGRVRMRMGFNWQPAFAVRRRAMADDDGKLRVGEYAACPSCGALVTDDDDRPLSSRTAAIALDEKRSACPACDERLWTLVGRAGASKPKRELLLGALRQIPTIGDKTAARLVARFGEEMLAGMLEDNLFEFINLMGEDGELVFSDAQARRMERAMANREFAFGQGGYQATEYVKRYLPQGYFGLLVMDQGHEFQNEGSAQGQAMGVLARKCSKVVLLTGTLMGGYADDLFHLLWRLHPQLMFEDGFGYNARKSLGAAQMAFMREHGVVKDIYKDSGSDLSHRTARASRAAHRTGKGPGFGPKGIARFVLPLTAFLKLKDIGGDVLPPYREHFVDVAMTAEQQVAYTRLQSPLVTG